MVHPDKVDAARALKPMSEREGFGRSILLFDGLDRRELAAFGETRTPSVADVFVAIVGDPGLSRDAASTGVRTANQTEGAAR
jgi:ABC-2 type transport system ATP-binding protein